VGNLQKALSLLLLFWTVLAIGCGGAEAPPPETPEAQGPSAEAQQVVQLEQQNDELAGRVRELEGRLSLSRAEARDLREAETSRRAAPEREVVRIRGSDPVAEAAAAEGWDEPGVETFGHQEEEDGTPRPVLRLYGSPAAAPLDTSTPLIIPPAPPGIPVGLPVAQLPAPERAFAAGAPPPRTLARSNRAERADQAALSAYQLALAHLRDRRYENALSAFDDFLRAHPRHPYAASAVYWQGEVHYAMRDYRRALARFSRVVDDYPQATKVADSLFKMGMCHKRMGRERAARRIFERVRRQFPESVAARLSVQEDA